MFLRVAACLLLLSFSETLFSQTYIGQRETVNYQKKEYNAGTQNWKIKQDAQGRMYFANNEGVLVFDGANWQLYPLPNKTIVWSIDFGRDKKLYAGGQDEMGYFYPDKNGRLKFTSLKHLLPQNEQRFSDVWNIVCYGDEVFFRTRNKVFRYYHNKITVYPPYSSWLFIGLSQNRLIAHDEQKGILVYKNSGWQTLISKEQLPNGFYITDITPFGKNASLVTTARNGVFTLSGNVLKYLPLSGFGIDNQQHLSGAIAIDEDDFLIGTYSNGVYQVKSDGTVVENLSKKEGLQTSNVRTMFMDGNRNVWLGLDNGIDFVAYNNAIKHINPPAFKDGGGFSMTKFNNSLYFALSNGVYKLPINNPADLSYTKSNFTVLSEGLSWQLSVVNNKLLYGNDEGAFEIKDDKSVRIDRSAGYWIFRPMISTSGVLQVAAGNYYGVMLLEQKNDAFSAVRNIGNYKESARFLEIDSNNAVWTSHPYRGVYKLTTGSQLVKTYTKADGLPSTLNNFVFKVKNRVVIATEKGIYEYNIKTDKFALSPLFKDVFGTRGLRYLKEDTAGNIWFVEEKNVGVADYSASKPQIIYFPELNNRILSGFESVYPVDAHNVFVGAENGFYHINYEKYKQNIQPIKAYIRKIKAIATTDSLLFGGYFNGVNDDGRQSAAGIPSLNHIWKSLHFEYSSPVFEEQANVQYSYFLEGFDKEWSEWSKKTEKDYTNLSAGTYTFKIKARSHQDNESAVSAYSFIINPPWYQTIWAFIIYVLVFIYALYYFYKLQEKKHIRNQEKELQLQRQKNEEEQKRIAFLHQLELEVAEKEVIKLKNEKLESEIEFKTSELASSALNLVQKKEFLLKVKDELQRINKSGKDTVEAVEIKKILRLLSEEKKINEEWEQFSVHFNKVHSDFLTIIKERYPTINQQEHKLCAYLIMNLSSKEIAQLMAISVRGVEISRYRLRKKLQIPTEINLFEFLFDIQRECMKPEQPH